MPMAYGELYIPNVLEGLVLRLGRYISVPDTEAQLAPNNYMYSHSMTYAYDNYTNTGLLATLQVTKNWTAQAGIVIGTDTAIWNQGKLNLNAQPPLSYTQSNKDPGVQPSFTACGRWQSDNAYNAVYVCGNGLNSGTWGYNNLQQFAGTFYHKFNDKWHITFEMWDMHEFNTPNAAAFGEANQKAGNFGNLGTLANGPWGAWCKTGYKCTSQEYAMVSYLNYRMDALNNFSLRGEFFNDQSGQRTGIKDRYLNWAIGWQHWFSPTVTFRPEIAFYNSLDRKAFNRINGLNGGGESSTQGTKSNETIVSADVIWHF
jgi:hypothetical protein